MKHKGPIITLAAGLVVAAILMVMNLNVTSDRDTRDAAADAGATTAPATPAAEPTPPPTTAPPVPAPTGTYAGQVIGGKATVAIASKDGQAIAYLCDGKSIEAWLQGTAADGELQLTGADNASLTGTYGNGLFSGTITAEGKTWEFSVPKVEPPSGLYRATANVRNADLVAGWIVVNGVQVGLGVSGGSTIVEIPTIIPGSGSVVIDDTRIAVNTVDGTKL